jgi:O-antigen/teichoic acid export membrane protein
VLGVLRLTRSIAVALRRVVLAFAPPLVLQPLLLIGFVALLLVLGAPPTGVAALLAAVAAGLLVLGGQLGFLKRGGLPLANEAGTLYDWRVWLAVGLPLILFDAFSMALRQADLMMIGVLMTPADAGIYGAALKTTGQTIFLLVSVNAVVSPMLASLWTRQDHKGLQRLLYMAAHFSFWPALAFVLVLSLFSTFILGLFGEAFVAAQWPMIILGVGQLFNAGTGVVVSLMIVSGHHVAVTRVFGISALLYVILLFFGIQAFGLIGAAVATALTMALWNIWLNRLALRQLHLHTSIVEAMVAFLKRYQRT